MIATVIVIALLALLIVTESDPTDVPQPRRDGDSHDPAGFRR